MSSLKPILVLLGIAVLTLPGCKKSEDIEAWFERTGALKGAALDQAGITPYRLEQHQALKSYFSQLGGLALSLREDEKLRKRFDAAFARSDAAAVCSGVLMPRPAWSEILGHCAKNGFFLCADEVRAYPRMVAALRDGLSPPQRARFDRTEACSLAGQSE